VKSSILLFFFFLFFSIVFYSLNLNFLGILLSRTAGDGNFVAITLLWTQL